VTIDLPERFSLATEPPTDARQSALREVFPEVFREDRIDFDALRRSLGDWAEPGPERFGLTWPGKAEAMRVIQEPSIGTLVPMPKDSVDWDTTHNVIIEGENLEVLKLLQKAYYGKVKLIYIDPPYNTGKEFIYPDNFREGLADYLRYSGQVDGEGFKVSANAETEGRYHSKWLSMMYPRLFVARNLLREDGIILVSIDDHEVHNLRALMNEIFGEENFVGQIVWRNVTDNNPSRIAIEHEYVLCYCRSDQAAEPVWKSSDSAARDVLVALAKELEQRFPDLDLRQQAYAEWFRNNRQFLGPLDRYKYIDEGGVYIGSQSVHNPGREGYRYDVKHPVTKKPCVQPLMGYRFPQETMQQMLDEGRILFGEDETKIVEIKVYASDYKQKLPSVITLDGRLGPNDLKALFPGEGHLFTNPKPVELLRDLFSFVTTGSDIVLDFFAGSGTSAEAVFRLNASDGGERRYLGIQLPEPVDNSEYRTIADITRERVRRAGQAIAGPSDDGQASLIERAPDLGFRAYRLGPSNFVMWHPVAAAEANVEKQLAMFVDHVAEGATESSMLVELLLKAGYPLTAPLHPMIFAGVPGFSVAEGALLVCLSGELTIEALEAMVASEPSMIVVLDAGFGGSDELKVNALQTVRSRNRQTGSDITFRVV
jgi:adenine-specific DNA-methyltransferase